MKQMIKVIILSKFVVKETDNGINIEFWGCVNDNEEEMICSTQYTTFLSYKKGIKCIKYNAYIAEIEDRTLDEWSKLKNPRFIIGLNENNNYFFMLTARNGTILTQSKNFTSYDCCYNGIMSLKRNSIYADIIKQ